MKRSADWILLILLGWPAASGRANPTPATSPPFETVVRAERPSLGPLSTRLSTEDARTLPGVAGDAVRAVESLAGVTRPALGSGQLSVWGAAPAESRILLDGIELPALYHLGGLRTIVPTSLVQSLTLLPGGYGAAYGRALGGLLLLHEQPLPDGIHGEVAADLLDVSATLSATLGQRLTLSASGRYSYFDRALATLTGQPLGDYFPLPRYHDFQARARLRLRPGEQLTATVLGAGDELRRARAPAEAIAAQSETWHRTMYRFGLQYQTGTHNDGQVTITPWAGLDDSDYQAAFGDSPARLSRRDTRYGLRAAYAAVVAPRVSLSVGVDVLGTLSTLSRQGTLTRPPREGDRAVFGQSPSTEQNADQYSTHLADYSPFLSLVLRLGRVLIEPGLRASGVLLDVSRLLPRVGAAPPIGSRRLVFTVEPRLLVRYQPWQKLTLLIATGLYHQPPDAADLSAVFGNPTLSPARAVHAVLAAEVTPLPSLRIELAGFYRYLDGLAARSPLETPPLARALSQDGRGQSFGGTASLQLTPWHNLSGSVSYTLSRAERQDAPSLPFRLADFDQPQILQVRARYVLCGFGIGLRLRYTSGLPRTEVIDSYYSARDDQFQPVFGTHNGVRLPDFVALDAQLDRTFQLRSGVTLAIWLDVQNLTNRKNAEELVYRYDFSEHDYITGLPTVAVLGARLSYF